MKRKWIVARYVGKSKFDLYYGGPDKPITTERSEAYRYANRLMALSKANRMCKLLNQIWLAIIY